MFGKLNAQLSVGARLGLVSGVFVAASALSTALVVSRATEGISFSAKEADGAAYLRDVWRAATTSGTVDGGVAEAKFHAGAAVTAFQGARTEADRLDAALSLITAVADGSNLTLDPDLDSFYTMDAATVKLPALLSVAYDLEDAARTEGDATRRSTLVAVAAGRLDQAARAASASMQSAAANNKSGKTRVALSQPAQDLTKAAAAFAAAVNSGADVGAARRAFNAEIDKSWQATSTELSRLLKARIDGDKAELALELALVGLLLAVASALAWSISGNVASRFTEAAFKAEAFETSAVATMMIDRDFKVTFVNEATRKLLSDNAATFAKLWPGFDPENIVGTCIDMFHKNPGHQRQMLDDPSRLPFRTDISVGDMKIALNVGAIMDERGRYVGNVLQWDDVTQARLNAGMLAALSRSQAVIEFNLDGSVVTANENFCRLLGYSQSEIVGKHHSLFVDPAEVRAGEYKLFWERLGRGEFVAGKCRRIAKGGREVWIEATYNPILDGAGRAFKVVKFATDVSQGEQERRQAEAAVAAHAAAQTQVVSSLAGGLKSLALGDVTARIDSAFPADYEQLRTDFNAAMDAFQSALGAVISNAGGIRSSAGEMSHAADDLARRTEQQAASLEETAAALDEVTATVRKTADGARQASTVVVGARADADASGKVVQETVEAMSEIEKSSKQISQIIGVIDEIAFQTNLLALNAGVEAARAGEAGRGFAVVASEVRALAQRSSDAAKEIKALISASSHHVDHGVELVGEAGKALRLIVTKVTEISGLVGEIAASAQEQSTALAEINSAINQMDQVTQQNAAMVEESTAASHTMAQDAQDLMTLVSRFNVGGVAAAPPTTLVSKPHRPVATAAPAAPAPAQQPIAAQRQRLQQSFPSSGSAALKSDDGWEEF